MLKPPSCETRIIVQVDLARVLNCAGASILRAAMYRDSVGVNRRVRSEELKCSRAAQTRTGGAGSLAITEFMRSLSQHEAAPA